MWSLALSTLRFRRSAFLAGFVAVFLGAAIITACGGLMETGIRLDVPPHRLAAATVVVTGEQTYTLPKADPNDDEEDVQWGTLPERVRIDPALVAKIAAVPGVAKAVPDVSFPATVRGVAQPLEGHGWASAALAPYSLSSGAAPAQTGDVVLDAASAQRFGKKVGDDVEITVRGVTEPYRVTGVAAPGAESGGPLTPALFFSAADTGRLAAGGGKVDAVGLIAAPDTDAETLLSKIQPVLDGQAAVALTGDDRGLAEFPQALPSSENLIVLAAVFGAMGIMVAMFVVASTLGLSVQQRQREMALLRAIGTTPGQVRRMVLGEAMAVSTAATLIGCVPGFVLGRWLFDRLVGAGVVPEQVAFRQGLVPILAGIGVSLLTALIAGFVTARRAALTRPTEALAEASLQPYRGLTPVRLISAGICFVAGLALAFVTMVIMSGPLTASTAGPAVLVWALGLAFLAPGITKKLTEVLGGPIQAFTGAAGYLAVLNAQARTTRMAAAILPVMLATGMATANLYMQTTQSSATQRAFTESLRADAVVTSVTGGVPGDVLDKVRALPEVGAAGATEFATSTGYVEKPHDNWQREEGWPIQGVTAEGAARNLTLTPSAGSLADLRGDTVALAEEHAKAIGKGVGIGDTISVRMGDNALVKLKVVALFPVRTGSEKFLMPARLVAAHTTGGLPSQILVRAAKGADTERLTAALGRVAQGQPGVLVADRGALTAGFAEGQQAQAWVNYLLVGMILAYTAISMVNTQVMATARRRREFGLQRLTGSTRAQVMQMMTVESVLVAAIGVLLGTGASLITLVPYSVAVDDTPLPSGPLWIYVLVVGFATALTVVATLLPTWLATRSRPAEAAMAAE
ncbi:FtsX-like permease family protein [Streptosporangium sp. NPDC051022]|uniref:FtsX-like permease family protein n=1 Tax=Streptosporangium sp. NPDC051022 TaxID=3155752 RepID=UPI00342D8ED5